MSIYLNQWRRPVKENTMPVKLQSFAELKKFMANKPDGDSVQLESLAAALGLKKGDVEWTIIKPSLLRRDFNYQRNPNRKETKEMASVFDMRLFGFPHIRRRPGGEWYIIDGSGRIYARYNLLEDDSPILCVNHLHVKTEQQESDWFVALNKLTRKVNKTDIFRAQVASGDKKACRLVELAERGGATINCGKKITKMSNQAAEFLDEMDLLVDVARLKSQGWPRHACGNPVWVALGAVLKSCPKIDRNRLIKIMRENDPDFLVGRAEAKYGSSTHARIAANRIAAYIILLYNYKLKKEEGIVHPQWFRVNDLAKEKPFSDRWEFCQIATDGQKPLVG